ncbi:MAG: hypothetical protein H7326_10405 [Bdellovibrionaceae bacterium]|nr:hypothetical protein [Pseudobdellovibrionaceae bacterium]
MDIVSYILHFNQNHSVLIAIATLFALFPLAILKKRYYLGTFMMIFGCLNFGFNSEMNRWYVNQHGIRGTGTLTEAKESSVVINKKPQREFEVLIKAKDGQIIKSSFASYDDIFINENPAEEVTPPPEIGEEFTILYLPGDLKNFAILVDDYKSPYGKRIYCAELKNQQPAAGQTNPPEADCP